MSSVNDAPTVYLTLGIISLYGGTTCTIISQAHIEPYSDAGREERKAWQKELSKYVKEQLKNTITSSGGSMSTEQMRTKTRTIMKDHRKLLNGIDGAPASWVFQDAVVGTDVGEVFDGLKDLNPTPYEDVEG